MLRELSSLQADVGSTYLGSSTLSIPNFFDILCYNTSPKERGVFMYNIQKNYNKLLKGEATFFLDPREASLLKGKLRKDEYKIYETFITSMLSENGVTKDSVIDKEDETYIAWKTEETISLNEYLKYAISMNWIEVSKIDMQTSYSDSDEVYDRLVEYIIEHLDASNAFTKKMIKHMIINDNLTYRQICMLLLEQDKISIIEEEKNKFVSGQTSPYDFMLYLIKYLVIN